MMVDVRKYNLIRCALADRSTPEEEVDIVVVRPKQFALKRTHDPEVLEAAKEILDDPRVMTGITPLDTIYQLTDDESQKEIILYILVCYAVALQQEWLVYSHILNRYMINKNHKEAVQYVEDIHHTIV